MSTANMPLLKILRLLRIRLKNQQTDFQDFCAQPLCLLMIFRIKTNVSLLAKVRATNLLVKMKLFCIIKVFLLQFEKQTKRAFLPLCKTMLGQIWFPFRNFQSYADNSDQKVKKKTKIIHQKITNR